MNKAEFMLQDAEREVARVHRELVDKANTLGERMTNLALRLDREGVVASVNELGEVQGLGADVDRLCCLLHQVRRTRTLMGLAVAATKEEW